MSEQAVTYLEVNIGIFINAVGDKKTRRNHVSQLRDTLLYAVFTNFKLNKDTEYVPGSSRTSKGCLLYETTYTTVIS